MDRENVSPFPPETSERIQNRVFRGPNSRSEHGSLLVLIVSQLSKLDVAGSIPVSRSMVSTAYRA